MNVTQIFVASLQNFTRIFNLSWLPIFLFTAPLSIGQQYFMKQASNPLVSENDRILHTLGAMSFNLVETFLYFLVLPSIAFALIRGSKHGGTLDHIRKYWKHLTIEVLRGIGSIATGLLKFIIPGLQRIFYYVFIPYVVQFDPSYRKGQVDALERSQELVKGNFWKISLIYTVAGLLNLLAGANLMRWNVFVSQLGWLAALLLYIAVEILTGYAICLTYIRLSSGGKDGASV